MTTSPLVPGRLPFAIDGHPFLIDPNYERETVQVIRQQSDTSTEPGEQSLTPLGLWRRSQESWHHGAGQDFLDGKQGDSPTDPHRFRSSKGIDPWTRGQITSLHSTLKSWSTTNTNLHLAVSLSSGGSPFVLHVADGTEVYAATIPFGALNSLALQQGTGWTPTNATIATTQVTRFTLTATSAAAVSAISPTGVSGMAVLPFRSYIASVGSYYVSGGAGRLVQIAVRWYDAAGATISTTTTVTGSDDTGPSIAGGASTTVTAPSNAAFAAVIVSWSTNFASGEIHRVHSVNIAPADAVGSFVADNWVSHAINAGEAVQTVQSLATDGYHLWAALGTSGLHRAIGTAETSTANVPAAPAGGQISLVGYANGFLLAAGSAGVTATLRNTLWLVSDPLGTPALSLIKTHPNPTFAWEGISSGRSCVYAFGNSGGNGEIYKINFDPNTGSLSTAASPASFLPDGETIYALYFYAGSIILGTGKGVRIGQADGAGNIDYGLLIETEWPVKCLEPQGRYCWFGWTKYDAVNSGLGRVDLGFLVDNLTPAWASDLMTDDTSTGDTVAAVTFAPYGYSLTQRPPVRVFTVAGEGVYIEDTGSRVPEGSLEVGSIRYSTTEPKLARTIDVGYHVSVESTGFLYVDLRTNEGTYTGPLTPLGTISGGSSYDAGDVSAEAFELRLRLGRGTKADGTKTSLEVTRWTLKALPLPTTIDETFTVEIIMKAEVETTSGANHPIDVVAEVAFLKGLERSRAIVEFQLGEKVHEGYVLSSKFKGTNWLSPKRDNAEGILTLTIQTARG